MSKLELLSLDLCRQQAKISKNPRARSGKPMTRSPEHPLPIMVHDQHRQHHHNHHRHHCTSSQRNIRISSAFRWRASFCYCCATVLLTLLLLLLGGSDLHLGGGIQCQEAGSWGQQATVRDSGRTKSSISQSRGWQGSSFVARDDSAYTQERPESVRARRSPAMPTSLLMPINELRISGSKNEPPSRPTVDWSKQRPYFGPDMARNVSVELGKTAYLTCKVFELGDKTVSWLRPRENEILTAGRYTYIGDSRFASINDNGSHDWILEIKDVGLNDSTSYECQVSTDPKMSVIINLQVKAAKAKIKQGEQFYAPLGSNIEFTCEIGQRAQHLLAPTSSSSSSLSTPPIGGLQQTYWYYNGNLLNYAKAHSALDKNFTIEWDSMTQSSRFRLFNIQLNDAGNYTCKPTSAEPATIRLHVRKLNKGSYKDRSQYGGNGYHSANTKEAQRTRQHFNLESGSGLEAVSDSGVPHKACTTSLALMFISCLMSLLLALCHF